MNTLSRWLYRIPAIVLSIAIFLVSHSSISVPPPFGFADKVYHVIVYAVYGLTLVLAARTFQLPPKKALRIAMVIGLVFAATDELHQSYIPGRSADVIDWLADAAGMGIAALVAYQVERHANEQTYV